MNTRRLKILLVSLAIPSIALACVGLEYAWSKFAFRGDSLLVLGRETYPNWESIDPPTSWLDSIDDSFGYVSYDGKNIVSVSSQIKKVGNSYVADFSDLEIENGKRIDVLLVTSEVRNIFGFKSRQTSIMIEGIVGPNGKHYTVDSYCPDRMGDTLFQLTPERNMTFQLRVIERHIWNGARACKIRFRVEPDASIVIL